MSEFVRLIGSQHRGSIAGKVVDAQTRQPIALAVAAIQTGPAAFQKWLATQSVANADRTMTAEDGFWGFLDLPDGQYTVLVEAPRDLHYGSVTRPFTVQQSVLKPSIVTIALPPTGASGTVQNKDTRAPLPLARVRVDGSSEIVYCDRNGHFVVSGVFPGACRLIIGAIGYRRQTVSASVGIGNIVELGTILLEPNGA